MERSKVPAVRLFMYMLSVFFQLYAAAFARTGIELRTDLGAFDRLEHFTEPARKVAASNGLCAFAAAAYGVCDVHPGFSLAHSLHMRRRVEFMRPFERFVRYLYYHQRYHIEQRRQRGRNEAHAYYHLREEQRYGNEYRPCQRGSAYNYLEICLVHGVSVQQGEQTAYENEYAAYENEIRKLYASGLYRRVRVRFQQPGKFHYAAYYKKNTQKQIDIRSYR